MSGASNASDFDGSQVSLGSARTGTDGGGADGASARVGGGTDATGTGNTYTIRPNFDQKFRPAAIKEMLRTVLYEELSGKEYDSSKAKEWSQRAADEIRQNMKGMSLDRYKFVVQVVIGEQRGQGIKMACRCLWDSDTDSLAQEAYLGETMFGVAAVFGVFFY